jgi:hypothetical protein
MVFLLLSDNDATKILLFNKNNMLAAMRGGCQTLGATGIAPYILPLL